MTCLVRAAFVGSLPDIRQAVTLYLLESISQKQPRARHRILKQSKLRQVRQGILFDNSHFPFIFFWTGETKQNVFHDGVLNISNYLL